MSRYLNKVSRVNLLLTEHYFCLSVTAGTHAGTQILVPPTLPNTFDFYFGSVTETQRQLPSLREKSIPPHEGEAE